ncbi:hypothetical protein R3W88_019534 [Solanum pinnatisectum]|uniref:RNase H type-1 domain-containing protein n=1 Tax=Solanum pinnatisectum TaxID=50273 RepID=A0AAV9KKK1_9SOLN|nr:hypothetical protein R3W88_019534 [Solanum pinnatisectum]
MGITHHRKVQVEYWRLSEKSSRLGGIGGVIRNHNGDWIIGFISREAHVDPVLAEIRTLKQGLLMAINHNLKPLDINTDSSQLITYLNHHNYHYSNLTLECRSLMVKLGATTPTHIFREQNQLADKLSKEGNNYTTFGHPTFWTTSPPFVTKLV